MQNIITPVPVYGSLSPHAADPDKIPVTAGLPYPELRVSAPNPDYAKILMADIGGPESELTAICQYLYDDWSLEPTYSSIADTLKRIAQVEMHHLDMLGQLIVMLGGSPRCETYDGNTLIPWSGTMLDYTNDPNQIIRRNLSLEEEAVNAYRSQAELIQDPSVSAILLRIALDEQVHVNILKGLLKKGR